MITTCMYLHIHHYFLKYKVFAVCDYRIQDMLKEIVDSRFYESDYRNITQKLLYEDIDYDYAVENGIAVVAESDVFIYKNYKAACSKIK